METKQIAQTLWDKGIRGVKISWSAGGDDGSVSDFELLPNDRKIDDSLRNELEELAWDVYENQFKGGTAGEFNAYGHLDILILEDGYKASAVNTYSEEEYNAETEEYENETSDTETLAEVILS